MKDGALSHYYWSPGRLDYAKSCSAQNAPPGPETRHERKASCSCPIALEHSPCVPCGGSAGKKGDSLGSKKTHTVSLSRLSDAAIPPHSKVSDNPACTRASLLFWNTPLQPRALNRGRRLFLSRTNRPKNFIAKSVKLQFMQSKRARRRAVLRRPPRRGFTAAARPAAPAAVPKPTRRVAVRFPAATHIPKAPTQTCRPDHSRRHRAQAQGTARGAVSVIKKKDGRVRRQNMLHGRRLRRRADHGRHREDVPPY